jgi:hypothetical protein
MLGKLISTGLVVAVVALGLVGTAGAAGTAEQPAWQKALHARSDALNRQYGLGKYAGSAASTSDQPVRLDDRAGPLRPAAAAVAPDVDRSQPTLDGGGFDWGDAGVGAFGALASCIVLAAGLGLTRRARVSSKPRLS